MASITTTSAPGFYKQVTITPPNPQQKPMTAVGVSSGTTTMRIGGTLPATSRMTVLPAATPLQTVSLAPTSQQINVPLVPGTRAVGKLISVTGAPGGQQAGPPNMTPPSVTIQKSPIPVSSQSPRTISLPYGAATQVCVQT